MSREFQPHFPSPTQIERRLHAPESLFWRTLFPQRIIDHNGSFNEAEVMLENGWGFNVIFGPHPAEADGPHGMLLLSKLAANYPITAPIAVHQLESLPYGPVLKAIARHYGFTMSPVVTARSQEKYPERYSAVIRDHLFQQMLYQLVMTIAGNGVGMEFIHGDRKLFLTDPVPRGVIATPILEAIRLKIDKFALIFVYLKNLHIDRYQTYRGLELGAPYELHIGKIVTLTALIEAAKSLQVEGRQNRYDLWAQQTLIDLQKQSECVNG
jgi:hypothetical protein